MDRLGFDLEDGTGSLSGSMETVSGGADAGGVNDEQRSVPAPAVSAQEARRRSIQTCLQSLVHACHCRDANCRLIACQKMKRLIQHSGACRRKNTGGCPVCKQLIALCCYHAKTCDMPKCPVPYCCAIREKLERQRAEQRLKQAQLMRRRMAAMQRAMTVESAGGMESVPVSLMPSSVIAQPPPTNFRDKNAQFVAMGHTVPVSPVGSSPYHRAVQSPFSVAASQQPVYDRRQPYAVISTTSSHLAVNGPVASQSFGKTPAMEMMTATTEFSGGSGGMLRERNEAIMLQQRHASVPASSLYCVTQHVCMQSLTVVAIF